MSMRRRIEERIRQKEQEIRDFEAKANELRVYVSALQDVLKMIPRENTDSDVALRSGSSVMEARDALRRAGKPMHISKILEAIGRDVNRNNRASLSGSISAYVRRGEIFTRPEPNTFGLVEFQNVTTEDEDEPPDDFGLDDGNHQQREGAEQHGDERIPF